MTISITSNGQDDFKRVAQDGNKGLPKAGRTNYYDSFVLNRKLVFQINCSAKIPRLRQYPKRYR